MFSFYSLLMSIPGIRWYIKRRDMIKYARYAGVRLGNNCRIYSVEFGSEPYLITMGDHVNVGRNAEFITHDGGVWVLRTQKDFEDVDRFGKITIGNNVFIGDQSIILPGVTIGDNVIIGAGSVVSKDIPSDSVASGVPARVIKHIEDYSEQVKGSLVHTKHLSYRDKKCYLISIMDKIEYRHE